MRRTSWLLVRSAGSSMPSERLRRQRERLDFVHSFAWVKIQPLGYNCSKILRELNLNSRKELQLTKTNCIHVLTTVQQLETAAAAAAMSMMTERATLAFASLRTTVCHFGTARPLDRLCAPQEGTSKRHRTYSQTLQSSLPVALPFALSICVLQAALRYCCLDCCC